MNKLSDAFLPVEYPYNHLEAIFQIGNPNCYDIIADQTNQRSQGVLGLTHDALEVFQSPHLKDLKDFTAKNFATVNFRLESSGGFVSIIHYQLATEQNTQHSNIIIAIGHTELNEDFVPVSVYPHFLMTALVTGHQFIPTECKCVKVAEDDDGVEQSDLLVAQNTKEFHAMICYANDAFENVIAGHLPEVANYQQWIEPENSYDSGRSYSRLCKRTPQSLTEDIKNGECNGSNQIVGDHLVSFAPSIVQ